jgi:hypothetical protein
VCSVHMQKSLRGGGLKGRGTRPYQWCAAFWGYLVWAPQAQSKTVLLILAASSAVMLVPAPEQGYSGQTHPLQEDLLSVCQVLLSLVDQAHNAGWAIASEQRPHSLSRLLVCQVGTTVRPALSFLTLWRFAPQVKY